MATTEHAPSCQTALTTGGTALPKRQPALFLTATTLPAPGSSRPHFARKSSSVTNLIEAYGSTSSASGNPRWSRVAFPTSKSSSTLSPASASIPPSPRKDKGFSEITNPSTGFSTRPEVGVTYSDAEAGPSRPLVPSPRVRKGSLPGAEDQKKLFGSRSAERASRIDYKRLMSKPATVNATHKTDSAQEDPTKGESEAFSARTDLSDESSVRNASAQISTSIKSAAAAPPSPPSSSSRTRAMRLPLTPTKASSPRKLKQRSEAISPVGPKVKDDLVMKEAARMISAHSNVPLLASRLDREDLQETGRGSPLRKLTRRNSSHRLRKDSGTAGHSRSQSLSRVPTEALFGPTSKDHPNQRSSPDWLQQDPATATSLAPLPATEATPVAMPQRKPSFYRRKRANTGAEQPLQAEASTFPIPSPVTEIARSMQSDKSVPAIKASISSGLLGGLGRKSSRSNLVQTATKEPRPLPAGFDYFVVTPASTESRPAELPQHPPAVSTRKPKHKIVPPVTEDIFSPVTPSFPETRAEAPATYQFPTRPLRSQSEPSQYQQNLAGGVEHYSRPPLTRNPVPRIPSDLFQPLMSKSGLGIADLSLVSVTEPPAPVQLPKGRHMRSATVPSSPRPDELDSSPIIQARRPSDTAHGMRSPIAALKDLFSPPRKPVEEGKAPISPVLQRTTRSGSASHKLPFGQEKEDTDREAKFLDLLNKSDSATDGVIKLSLTTRAARDSFAI